MLLYAKLINVVTTKTTGDTMNSRFSRLLVLALAIGCISVPAMAGEKYTYGSPELMAAISGTNEFAPGDTVPLTVIIENSGLNQAKIVKSSLISRDDLPNTAKLVKVTLSPGQAPITVKTDTQMIGDLLGGMRVPVTFNVKFDSQAAPGLYDAEILVEYTYLFMAEQTGLDMINYIYRTTETSLPLALNVQSDVSIEITDTRTESVNVGTEGYLTLTVRNAGYENATKAVVKIAPDSESPLIPTDASVYIGDFPPGSTEEVTFKVAVSKDAEEKEYPLDVYVEYENEEGDSVTSARETIGIPVGGKIDFAVISGSSQIKPGEKSTIAVTFKNSGSTTVHDATARISAVDPFSSNDDTAFLGELAPGETATARFEISAGTGATIKTYGLDSEIRYKDALGNTQISDTMKVEVEVIPRSGSEDLLSNPLLIAGIIFGIVGAGYYLWSKRTKK
jgi:hypothetical protein